MREEQFENNLLKDIILFKFHFEMSGNSFNDEHLSNNPDIS